MPTIVKACLFVWIAFYILALMLTEYGDPLGGDGSYLLYCYPLMVGLLAGFLIIKKEGSVSLVEGVKKAVGYFSLGSFGIFLVCFLLFALAYGALYLYIELTSPDFLFIDSPRNRGEGHWLVARYLFIAIMFLFSIIGASVGGVVGAVFNYKTDKSLNAKE